MGSGETRIEYDVIDHDGGSHLVEAETNTDGTATIYFGASFTLRLDEHNVDKLRALLHDVSCNLKNARSLKRDADTASMEDLVAADEILSSLTDDDDDDTCDYAGVV